VNVRVPSNLADYTNAARVVQANGRTLGEALGDLERRYPGIRFRIVSEQDRIRRHIKIFVNRDAVRDLATPLSPGDEIMIVAALSGG
jgi:molybdopterin converting factor small subunit